jgi:BirA family biotin operon repressor/biotin-[acetyl-CoA-carboxylase] ligase
MVTSHHPWRTIGQQLRHFAILDSTNSYLLDRIDEQHGIAILADEQTAGRGQQGRRWHASPRSSVLLSVLLHPPKQLMRPIVLTAFASVSACAIIGQEARIKWPNDVLVDGKKIAGILIEQREQGVVVGIGLNVAQTAEDFEKLQLPGATSLQMLGRERQSVEVAHELLDVMDHVYQLLLHEGETQLQIRWRNLIGLHGQRVRVQTSDGDLEGQLSELSFREAVVDENGTRKVVPLERVLQLTCQS